MKFTQFYLKQVIKEEIEKAIEQESSGPVIPDVPREAREYGIWESEKSFPNGEAVFSAANKKANEDWNKVKGKYNVNNSCVAAYGYDSSGKPVVRVWRPDNKKGYGVAVEAVVQVLRKAGFSMNSSLPVPASSAY